ncbi:unnamed protein product [Prorocentrum cordatum]|uniref:Uncharacterized protein n=1 Tax=Prorocentrum cordatum TaxID=2364126 RepID=A0ABN9PVL5_9DINO|nr:unnamed protein product [Polarella glacialis]
MAADLRRRRLDLWVRSWAEDLQAFEAVFRAAEASGLAPPAEGRGPGMPGTSQALGRARASSTSPPWRPCTGRAPPGCAAGSGTTCT